MNDLLSISFTVACLLIVRVLSSSWFKGKSGEHRVSAALRSGLNPNDYVLLNDLTLPAARGTTQIDHVIISRFGIFVVETKNMSGWIFGSATQQYWTQALGRRKFRMQNPLQQNFKHVRAVRSILKVDRQLIHDVVVFVGPAEPRTTMPENVVWGVGALLHYIMQFEHALLTPDEMSSLTTRLKTRAVERSWKSRRDHAEHVRAFTGQLGADKAICPMCGASMVGRTNHKSGEHFLGCVRFPRCKGTRNLG